jgi:predicted phosphoribosyltransferase
MKFSKPFRDRSEAGRVLAEKLKAYAHLGRVVVLALPRGGLPVAFEVAKTLDAALDVFIVRKLGLPGQEELAMGAIATGGVLVINGEIVRLTGVPEHIISAVADRERRELDRRQRLYRGNRPDPIVRDRIVILVDDGLATGSTMRAAATALRQQGPERLVAAVPIAPPDTCAEFRAEVDEVVCAITPEPFYEVGRWYEDFSQTTDEEVRRLLALSAESRSAASLPTS